MHDTSNRPVSPLLVGRLCHNRPPCVEVAPSISVVNEGSWMIDIDGFR
jgi:hypothetical protein